MEVTGDKLVRDVRVVVHDAEDLIKATAGDIEERTREARAKLAGALVVAKETLNQAERTTSDSARAIDSLIRQYPYPALGVAFLAGSVLGALLLRR
jgi:ElaB/YqjD/DUF883 family membrane-anchored ribosome-binding protein